MPVIVKIPQKQTGVLTPNILNNSDELKNNKVEIKVVEVLFL